eukprot:417133_1
MVEDPTKADPNCANIIGYGEQWCIEKGKIQNVTTTIKQTMITAGYNVQLYGKMDIGGGMSAGPNMTTNADGFHSPKHGNWSTQLDGCNISSNAWCPGCIIHSWTRASNISCSEWLPPYMVVNTSSTQGGFFTPHDEKVAHQCINFLDNYSKTNESEPFLLYCSMVNPHPPYWSNQTWFKYLNETALNKTYHELINNWNDGVFYEMHEADKYNSNAENVGNRDINQTWAYNLLKAYFGACVELDYWMGLIINKLKSYPNLYENTVIVYTTDHGELHLEHLQLQKMSMYEGSARIPLIVSGSNIPKNKIIQNFTTLVDLFPTFLDAASVEYVNNIYPKNLNGYSLSPFFNWNVTNNPYLNRPNYAFSEYHGDCTNTAQFMLRQNEYKLILYATNPPFQHYKPQLFNVKNDPNELNDISNENQQIVENMTNIINEILHKTGGGDYNEIDKRCQTESKQNFLRWKQAIDDAQNDQYLWIEYVNASYTNFDTEDLNRINSWSNE